MVITGSSSGIGAATALALARAGNHIVLHGRRESDRIRSVAETIRRETSAEVDFLYGDFHAFRSWQMSDWQHFVDSIWKRHTNIVAWVNNAGGDVLTGSWKDRPLRDKLDYLQQVDVAATLFLSMAVGERMRNHAPSGIDGTLSQAKFTPIVINVGWDQAQQGMAGESGILFSATKGAIMAMTKSLAQEYAPDVRFNCVAPGWIQTAWGETTSDYWDQRARGDSLLGRWGTPQDVASTIAFLCSPAGDFLNGQVIPVNGGFRFHQHNLPDQN